MKVRISLPAATALAAGLALPAAALATAGPAPVSLAQAETAQADTGQGSAGAGDSASGTARPAGPPAVGDRLGTTIAEVAAALEAAGHTVREIEREGGRFEVEIGRGRGRGHEIYVDAATGRVTRVERTD